MPQNNYLPLFQASYPLLAPYQKPGGVTVLTTATAPRVPNKFTYAAGTIQSYQLLELSDEEAALLPEEQQEQRRQMKTTITITREPVVDEAGPETEPPEPVEEEEGEPPEDDDNDDKSRSVPKGKHRRR